MGGCSFLVVVSECAGEKDELLMVRGASQAVLLLLLGQTGDEAVGQEPGPQPTLVPRVVRHHRARVEVDARNPGLADYTPILM